jgi:hypothetical protein
MQKGNNKGQRTKERFNSLTTLDEPGIVRSIWIDACCQGVLTHLARRSLNLSIQLTPSQLKHKTVLALWMGFASCPRNKKNCTIFIRMSFVRCVGFGLKDCMRRVQESKEAQAPRTQKMCDEVVFYVNFVFDITDGSNRPSVPSFFELTMGR